MKPSISRFIRALRSSARDVALIVIGILVAFVLDAWWDDRIEQSELDETLRAVRTDFLATKAELNKVVDANKTYIQGVSTLVSTNPGNVESIDTEEKAKLAHLLPTGGLTFDPVLGSLDAFIASGKLNRVSDIELRSLIGAWYGLMDEIGEDHDILIDMYMAQQERSIELGIYLKDAQRFTSEELTDTNGEILLSVLADEEMLNRLLAHKFAVESLNDELAQISDHLDKILSAMDRNLDKTGLD